MTSKEEKALPEDWLARELAVGKKRLSVTDEGAWTLDAFCEIYGIRKNLAYDEIAAGRLPAVKVGSRKTLIPRCGARQWLQSLPPLVLSRSDLPASAAA